MPRPQRFQVAGVPQHVVQRGVNRQAVFFTGSDREFFLDTLAESASWYGMHVHAYCLMTNHIHWSSYGHNGLGMLSPLVTPHATYVGLGTTSEHRRANYRALFAEVMGADLLRSVRDSLQQNHVFGSDRFKWRMETMLARKLRTGKRGRPKKEPSPGAGSSANSSSSEK